MEWGFCTLLMAHVLMAHVLMAHVLMAYVLMAYVVRRPDNHRDKLGGVVF